MQTTSTTAAKTGRASGGRNEGSRFAVGETFKEGGECPNSNSATASTTKEPKQPAAPTSAAASKSSQNTDAQRINNLMLAEIKHFGGSQEDLDLIKDDDQDAVEQLKARGSALLDSLGVKIPNLNLDPSNKTKKNKSKAGKKGGDQEEDDSEIAKALKEFMTKSLKMDPSKTVVPVIADDEEEQEEVYSDLSDLEEDHGSDNDDDDIKPEKPVAAAEPRQKGVPQPKNDPSVAKRVTELLNSTAFNHPAASSSSTASLSKRDAIAKLIFEPTPLWHAVELAPIKAPKVYSAQDEVLILKMFEKAKALYQEEVANYDKIKFQSASDRNFIKTVLKSGTTTDKISALTLLIQESPLHTLHYLRDQIIHGMARKKSRRDALVAVDAVKDLLTSGGMLPDTRKLKYFRDQGVLNQGVQPIHLIVWYFEDSLKRVYFEFLQLIEELSKDPLEHVKSKTLIYIVTLLVAKPEAEASLLSLLVNKLGDASNPLAFKAAHLLQSQLLAQHPNMKLVVTKEVERLLVRSKGNSRARYACLSFLSQIVLRRDVDLEVSRVLVGIYFDVFEAIVESLKNGGAGGGAAGEVDKKDKKGNGKKGKKNRYASSRPKKKGKPLTAEQAMADGEEVVGDSEDEAEAEEGRADGAESSHKKQMNHVVEGIDAKTMACLLTGVNRAFPYAQMDDDVFNKHMNTLFKISHLGTFNISIQALTLIFQVHASRQTVSDRFYCALYDTLIDSRLPSCSKHPMYLNLLHRALKADTSLTRLRAFIKRIIQACGMNTTPFICGALFLVGDIMKNKPGLWSLVTMGEDGGDEEKFVDVNVDEDEGGVATANNSKYDGRKRNPLYCGAEYSSLWELTVYANHFHPTVALYAQTLLSGNPITIPPTATAYDPLQNHTLARFLDRFVFKNPKKVTSAYRGSSLMQARPPGMQGGGAVDEDGVAVGNLIAGARKRGVIVEEEGELSAVAMDDEPVNSAVWLNRKRENIPVDELFFYDFFADKKARDAASTKSKKKNQEQSNNNNDDFDTINNLAEPDDSDNDELDEDQVWQAMQSTIPKTGDGEGVSDDDGGDDDDDDFDMEAAMREAEEAGTADRYDSNDDDDDDDGFEDADFAQFEQDVGEIEFDKQEDQDEAGDDESKDEEDEDGLVGGVGADKELASMFMDDEDEDVISDEEEEEDEEPKNQQGRVKNKVQKLADAAKKLGYKGSYFESKLGKKKGAVGAAADDDFLELGGGFASMDDFKHLIDRDDEDEDTGAFGGGSSAAVSVSSKKRKLGGQLWNQKYREEVGGRQQEIQEALR
ncbi:CBF/Mak21 family-domain-containing protein, partial [Obelidium mucronatum]